MQITIPLFLAMAYELAYELECSSDWLPEDDGLPEDDSESVGSESCPFELPGTPYPPPSLDAASVLTFFAGGPSPLPLSEVSASSVDASTRLERLLMGVAMSMMVRGEMGVPSSVSSSTGRRGSLGFSCAVSGMLKSYRQKLTHLSLQHVFGVRNGAVHCAIIGEEVRNTLRLLAILLFLCQLAKGECCSIGGSTNMINAGAGHAAGEVLRYYHQIAVQTMRHVINGHGYLFVHCF